MPAAAAKRELPPLLGRPTASTPRKQPAAPQASGGDEIQAAIWAMRRRREELLGRVSQLEGVIESLEEAQKAMGGG